MSGPGEGGQGARLWIRLIAPGGGRIGPGKIALLKAVAEHGSISAAARAMDMSYRRAWLLLEATNEAIGAPAVETSVGGRARGGASVTEAGGELIALYERIAAGANESAAAEIDGFFAKFPKK